MKHKSSAFKSFLIIIAVILFSFVTLAAGAQEVKADLEEGTCGEQVYWYLTDNGYLNIHGKGKMTDYDPSPGGNDTTWNSNNWGHFIKSVEIKKGVTSIGDYAFFNVTGMRKIEIPETVTTIGKNAFENCGNLRSITIPNSVTSIGFGAFSYSGITSVKIPSKMKTIGNGAFASCYSLESVTIPDSVTYIDVQAFGFCSSLKSIDIPNRVTSIDMYAFQGCESLECITIPDSVTAIGGGAFDNCTGLKSINIPKSVTYIGYGAFSGCSNLKHVYYGGSKADLKNVNIGKGNDSLNNATWHYSLYSITYDANGGVGAPEVQDKAKNVSVKLSTVRPTIEYEITFDANRGNVSTESKTVQGTFQKWNTKRNGKGTSYNPGATYTDNASTTLYAQWSAEAGTLPTPTRSGKTFSGWFTEVNGGKQIINSSKITGNVTLYAHWTDSSDPYNFGDETYSFKNYNDYTGFGQCFGMSITSSGFHNNFLDLESYCGDASKSLYSLSRTQSLEDLIMYYAHIQGSYREGSSVAGGYWYYHFNGKEDNRVYEYDIDSDWEEVVNYVKDHKWDNTGLLQINFTKKGSGCHAVNFIRYENVSGQDRIYIYDNNFPDQECYFYKDILGNVKETPKATFSGALDGICLNNVQVYFRLADSYDATRAVYMPEDSAYVKGCSYTLMSGDISGQNYVMYEIPEDMDQITIVPKEDNATFIYLDKEYSFEEITEETVGELVLATADEGGVVTDEIFEIYEEEPEPLRFNDVQNPSAWYYDTVYEIASTLNEKGHPLMSGYSNGSGNFGPADPLTRQDFAIILYRLANEPEVPDMENPFKDTNPKGYYYTCVLWTKASGVIAGYNDGRFGVGDKITREQVATILYRFASDYMNIDTSEAYAKGDLTKFTDGKAISGWAKEALTWATGAGVITGKSNGTKLDARGNAARAEIGAMILRFITYMENAPAKTMKVGLICANDENATYDLNFINGFIEACEAEGVEYVIRTNVSETQDCYNTAVDLAGKGCTLIFADGFGHEDYMIQAAKEFPNVQFCHATGTKAHTEGLDNYANAFAAIYEGRFLTGVAAGMKLNEMIAAGTITADQAKIGYVGAFTYAEVISGYTSFYLGAKSVCPNVIMDVTFTGSWYDPGTEQAAAETLIKRGCALLSQHSDSLGAPTACENAGIPNVSYNVSTQAVCPNTYIVSSRINWVPYYRYAIQCVKAGKNVDTDWTGTLGTGSVQLNKLNDAVAAAGTAEAIEAAKAKLQSGELRVFDTATFTVSGEVVTTYLADVDSDPEYEGDTEVIIDGAFAESTFRSAPYFDLMVDGITLLNVAF